MATLVVALFVAGTHKGRPYGRRVAVLVGRATLVVALFVAGWVEILAAPASGRRREPLLEPCNVLEQPLADELQEIESELRILEIELLDP